MPMLVELCSQAAEATPSEEAEKADTCSAFARSSVGWSILVEVPFRLQKPLLQQKQRRLTHVHTVLKLRLREGNEFFWGEQAC